MPATLTLCAELPISATCAQNEDFLSQNGFFLHSSNEFHDAPRTPIPPAPSPFDPKTARTSSASLVSAQFAPAVKAAADVAIQLATDTCGREVLIKAVPPGLIKAVPPGAPEAQILERLTSPTPRSLPENHTISVPAILYCENAAFLVQARWGDRPARYPSTVAFWVGVQAYQPLQGLAFIHEHGIAC
ncbi:hypothetical protein DFH08DRAFT_1082937, partial [Mycena albidolilacea]